MLSQFCNGLYPNDIPQFSNAYMLQKDISRITNTITSIWYENMQGYSGLKVNFLIHLKSLASKIFSASKLVRPLADSLQMFGRSA